MKKVVDLTLPIVTGHWRYPNVIRPFKSMDEGDASNITYYELRSHWFTHIDFPRHMQADGKTSDDYAAETFLCDVYFADVSTVNANEAIDKSKLAAVMGDYKGEAAIFIKTSWGSKCPWDSMDFWDSAPYLTRDAAEYIRSFEPSIVGYDFPQDYDIRKLRYVEDEKLLDMVTHEVLLKNGILMIEYMTNMWEVTAKSARLYALPLNMSHADGAQIRVLVEYDT